MQAFLLGLNHITAPLAVRERVAWTPDAIAPTLTQCKERLATASEGGLDEIMILSTCNRTEFYAAAANPVRLRRSLLDFIAHTKHIDIRELEAHCYSYTGIEAARHLYSVVSGMDSMVLGETQIVGQFKKAVQTAHDAKTLGLQLNHLFQEAFSVAKLVRSTTEIGANSVSLAAAAVRLSHRLFGELKDSEVLFIGAGEMIELCAAHFAAQSPKSITVANRTTERGKALADRYHGTAIKLQDVPAHIGEFDIIISCTASALPIIGLGMIQRAMHERRQKPLCIVDLAVPRDVEAEVSELDNVYVYTMDELGAVVQSGKEARAATLKQANQLIQTRLNDLERWLAMRNAVPTITAMRRRAEEIRSETVAHALQAAEAGHPISEVLEVFSKMLTHKLIHDPTVLLRDAEGLSIEEREHMQTVLGDFFRPKNP